MRLRTVGLAWAVARAAGVVVIDSTTPSCALTTSEVGQLHAAKDYTGLAAAAPCVLYDTAATAPPADVTELTIVQAGPSYCMEHLAGAKVAVDTLNALNGNKGVRRVDVASETMTRGVTMEVTLSATNFLGLSHSAKVAITKLGVPAPTLRIAGANPITDATFSSVLKLQAVASLPVMTCVKSDLADAKMTFFKKHNVWSMTEA